MPATCCRGASAVSGPGRSPRSPSLEDALAALSGSAYGRYVRPGMGLARAQRAVAETALWHIRVLAGWAPPGAQDAIRALAAWFELANIEDRLAFLAGGEATSPFALGGLATAWPRLAEARTVSDVRGALAASPWGDPGDAEPADLRLGLRLAWARRVLQSVPEAGDWAAGAVRAAGRTRAVPGRAAPPDDLATHRPPGIGVEWAAGRQPADAARGSAGAGRVGLGRRRGARRPVARRGGVVAARRTGRRGSRACAAHGRADGRSAASSAWASTRGARPRRWNPRRAAAPGTPYDAFDAVA